MNEHPGWAGPDTLVPAPVADPPGRLGRLWSRTLQPMLALPIIETRVARRGFQVDSAQVVQRLEAIGARFAHGYNSALRSAGLDDLATALQAEAPADAGFAFEGAAMGLALVDGLTPGRHWWQAFVAGPARQHDYMAWVGLGWALARLPGSPQRALRNYPSIKRWLALDGWGFHAGYFDWRRSVLLQRRPASLQGPAARVFDQGLGRSLWFVWGAKPLAVQRSIARFAADRQADLWSGIGLAAAYAGAIDEAGLIALRAAAAGHGPDLGQGVAFAAEARWRAGNAVPHTERACQALLGLSLAQAAALARASLPAQGDDLASYQRWRAALRAGCAQCPDEQAACGPGG